MSIIPKSPFVLVDGSSYLFRAYHALPPLTNSRGEPTGAVYGVANMLRKLINQYDPQLIAVVFDCKEKTFRHEMFPEYKANRTVMPDDLALQIKPLHALIRAMGLPLIAIPGVEADDVIGTLAMQASKAGLFTLISTGDKDMAQLVNEQIVLVNTMSDTILDRDGVIKKFEVTPEQMIDYLSLIGDSVDNIPGVYKVGPKTAVKWLQTYHNLDNIIAKADEITGKVGENLRAAIPDLPLYKELITIKTDVQLSLAPQELSHGTANVEELRDLYSALEFKAWLKQVDETLAGVGSSKSPAAANAAPTDYSIISTQAELSAWIQRLTVAESFAFNLYTNTPNYMQAQIIGISCAIEPGVAAYIPIAHNYMDAPQQLGLAEVLLAFTPLFRNPEQPKIMLQSKFVIEVLQNYDLELNGNNFDVLLASYVLNSVAKHNLPSLAHLHLNLTTLDYEEIAGKGAKEIEFNQIEISKAAAYAAQEADVTLQLARHLEARLKEIPSLDSVFAQIEMPLVPVLATMERRGVLIDVAALEKQSIELGAQLTKLEHAAHSIAAQEFNLGSPKQLQEVLFEKLQLPVLEKTPTGQPSTSEPVLQELANDFELPRIILEYRTLSKLKSTYTDKLPLLLDPGTGRVHTSYQQSVTATGRLSSTDPNLQNIPIRTAEGRRIRSAFIAPPGYKIVSADYSQIELRIMAHLSKDKGLLDTFAQGLDVHRATASEVFGVPKDQVTDDQRRHSKAINFGLIYGMSGFGLGKQLGIDRQRAELYIETYFARFPGVREYMENTRNQASLQGYVETLYGRRLYLPDIRSTKVMLKRAAERAAINAPLQGAQSDIIKLAMIEIHNWLQTQATDAHMIMQVHDELVFEIPEAKVEAYSKRIVELMSGAAQLSVSLDVGVSVGDTWS